MAAPNCYHHTFNPPPQPQLQPPPTYYPYPPPATYHHYPPPPPSSQPYYPHYPPPSPPTTVSNNISSIFDNRDERKTLFIAGLPDDIKAREIYNLFRQFPGFKSHQLCDAGQKAYAFAVFADHQSAAVAMQSLDGLVFDLQREVTLHVDFAKSNSRSKRSRTDHDGSYSPDKKYKGTDTCSRNYNDSGVGTNSHLPGAHSIHGYSSTQSHTMHDYGTTDPTNLNTSSSSSALNCKPCSTLFVANLGPACTKMELNELFSRCPGFTDLKMQRKAGLPVAFVNFEDITSSTGALEHLQGTHLPSSLEVGLRIEYAKSPMRQKSKDRKR